MSKKKNFIRVKKEDGTYGYVQTNSNNRALEFDANRGMFKIHDLPNEKSHFTWGWNVPEVVPTSKNTYNGGDIGEITVTAKAPEKKFIQADNMFYPTDEMIRKRQIMDNLEMAAGNLMTGGYASIAKSGAEEIKNGNYITGAFNFASPLMAPSFISAPVKMAKGLIGATIADKVSNDVWQRTFGRGNTLAQDISNATGLSESDSHFFNPATWWGFKMGMNTHRWRPNGELGVNGVSMERKPISEIFEQERWNRFRNPKYVTEADKIELRSHFPEYKAILERAMDEGSYMIIPENSPLSKMSTRLDDGRLLFTGDEGTWILAQSKNFKAIQNGKTTKVGFKGGTDLKGIEGVKEVHAPETFPNQENGVFFAGPRLYADTYNSGYESPGYWLFFRSPYNMLNGEKRAFPLEDNTVRFVRGVMSNPSYRGGEVPIQTYETINKAWNSDYLNNPEIMKFLSKNPLKMSPSELVKREILLRTIRQGQLSENQVKFNVNVETMIRSGKLLPLRSQYYDGFIGRDHVLGWSPRRDFKWPFGSNPETYVIFRPELAKLLVGNNGAFGTSAAYSRKKGGELNLSLKIKSK